MQSGLNSVSMAVGVMEMALYSSYTPDLRPKETPRGALRRQATLS
jgi:hypothetical protein